MAKSLIIPNWKNGVKEGIIQEFTITYYHQHKGRIERANHTIREKLKKLKGPIQKKLKEAIEAYNDVIHRGIVMSPNEAMKIKKRWSNGVKII